MRGPRSETLTRPRPEQQLILIAAGTARRREVSAARAATLATAIDWPLMGTVLRERRLLTRLGPRLLELGDGSVPPSFAATVEEALAAGRRHGAVLQLLTQQLTTALAAERIRSAPLKGPLLGELIYGDPGRRLSNDIDLLVAPEQLQAALAVARDLGYGPPDDYVGADGLPRLHFALTHERDELPPLELHWRIHWYEREFAAARLLPPTLDATASWQPEPADQLAALLLYYARDGFVDLRLAADVGAWWDACTAQMPPAPLGPTAGAFPALRRALTAAAIAARRIVGLPAERLLEGPPPGLRTRVAVGLANPNPAASPAQVYAEIGLIDGLLAPPGGMRAFLRRQVLMPSDALAAQDRRLGRAQQSSRLGRGIRLLVRCAVLGRYLLAIGRLRRA